MENKDLQARVDAMDRKLDLIMEYVQEQRQSTHVVTDLVDDLAIIGKDVYHSAVDELDKRQVELNPEELTELAMSFLRNIKNFSAIMNTMESMMDLLNDLSPILNEAIIDVTKKVGEFEEKGYFDFLAETGNIIDNIVTGFTPEDVKALADNIVLILNTVKDMTQPKMMKSMDNAVKVFANIETEDIPEVSVWKLMRTMNKPEIKKGIGFLMTFMQNISKNIEQKN